MSERETPKVSRAAYMREYRAKRKVMAASLPTGTRLVIGGDTDPFYLTRIAELEEEVRKLTEELAKLAARVSFDAGAELSEPPSFMTADGTRGMQRGVSAGQRRPPRRTGSEP